MKRFYRYVSILFCWVIFSGCAVLGKKQGGMNVLLITADDLGWRDLSS